MSKKNQTLQSILVPIDFSEPSRHALEYAVALAEATGARLGVLHVYREKPNWADEIVTPIALGYSAKNFDLLLQEAAKLSMEKFLQAYSTKDLQITPEIAQGSAVETITQEAQKKPHDLIVMGRKGEGNVVHFHLGSIVDRVLRHSKIPVLVIPEKEKSPKKFKTIVVAVDLLEASEDALRYAISLASTLNAKVIALYVSEPPLHFINLAGPPVDKNHLNLFTGLERANLDRLEEFTNPLLSKNVDLVCRVVSGEEAQSITDFAVQEHADLIVMGSVGKSGLTHLLLGSTAEKVLRTSKQPVLIVKLRD